MTIRQVRELRQLSQTELAREAGIARTHLIRIEQQGSDPRLTLTTLTKLASALGVPATLLIDQGSVR